MKQKNILATLLLQGTILFFAASTVYGFDFESPLSTFDENDMRQINADNPPLDIPVKIDLSEYVEVKGPHLYFGDIGTCEGNVALCEEMYGVDIGLSPSPGKKSIFKLSKVKEILNKEFPDIIFKISGAKTIEVSSLYNLIDEDLIRDELNQSLNDINDIHQNIKIELQSLKYRRELKIWPGDFTLRFPLIEKAKKRNLRWILNYFLRSVNLVVEYVPANDEQIIKKFMVHSKFTVKQYLPVAIDNLKRGQIIKAGNFEEKWVPVKITLRRYYTSIDHLVGKKLKRNLNVGDPVLLNSVARRLAVKRGDFVKMIIKKQGLKLNARVIALENGSIGDKIRVMYPNTKKRLFVRILNSSLVEVIR